MQDFNYYYEKLIDEGYFTEEELALVTNINGDTIEVLNDCVYARFGLRSVTDLVD